MTLIRLKNFLSSIPALIGMTIVSTVLAIGVVWLVPVNLELWCIVEYGYWFLLTISVLFSIALWLLFKKRREKQKKNDSNPFFKSKRFWVTSLVIALGSGFLFTQWNMAYTVYLDEPVQASTALAMHLKREIYVPSRAYTVGGSYQLLEGSLDKRPALYSFLVSLAHDFTGFRPSNAFWVNIALTPLLLLILFGISKKLTGWKGGIGTIFAILTLPLLGYVIHGGGFELLSLCLISLCLYLSILHLEKPLKESLWALVLCAVLLSQVRYEAMIFSLAAVGIILISWKKARYLPITWPIIFVPFFFVPALWHRRIFQYNERLWEMGSKGAQTPFDLSYTPGNFGHAVYAFFGKAKDLPNSIFISAAGTVAFITFAIYCLRRLSSWKKWPNAMLALAIFEIAFLGLFTLLLAYFWGQLDDYVVMRLGLPLALGLTFPIIYFAFRKETPKWARSAFWILITVCFFTWSLPKIATRHWGEGYHLCHLDTTVTDFIQTHQGEKFVMVSDFPTLWINQKANVLGTQRALKRKPQLKALLESPTPVAIYLQELLARELSKPEVFVRSANPVYPELNNSILNDPDCIWEVASKHYVDARCVTFYRLKDIKNTTLPTWETQDSDPLVDWGLRVNASLP